MTDRAATNDRDFLTFWIGQTISVLGSAVSAFALPQTAILLLRASALQMGVLQALSGLPYLLASLPIGVIVDRVRRRPLMIAMDLGRTLLMALVPVLALRHRLHMADLYAIVPCVGVLSVTFDTACQAYVPLLVGRERLAKANGSIQLGQSMASIGGPSLAGLLIRLLTAPLAVSVDAASFVISAVSLMAIRHREPAPARRVPETVLKDIRDGLRFLYAHRILAPLTLAGGITGLCFSGFLSVYFLYLSQDAHLSPSVMGLILSVGAVGATVGALVIGRLAERLGYGRTFILCQGLFALAAWLVPCAGGPPPARTAVFMVAAIIAFFAGYSGGVTGMTLRQRLTPAHMLGRMTASAQLVLVGLGPIGSLIGGFLGQAVGLRATLVIASAGMSLVVLWLQCSPVRSAEVRERVEGGQPVCS